jgi:hypothetical protein
MTVPIRTHQGMLDYLSIVQTALAGNRTMRLFTAPAVPTAATLLAGVTEATFPGYAAVPLVPSGAPIVDGNGNGANPFPSATFTATGGAPQTVYGWYVTDDSNAKLIDIKLFDAGPLVFQNNGDTFVGTYTDYQGQLAPPY